MVICYVPSDKQSCVLSSIGEIIPRVCVCVLVVFPRLRNARERVGVLGSPKSVKTQTTRERESAREGERENEILFSISSVVLDSVAPRQRQQRSLVLVFCVVLCRPGASRLHPC